jgi:NADP-dependent 3-hydroxy acid dehydrogenase YdfG
MKKILIAGNSNYGLAEGLKESLAEHDVTFISRSCGYDLTKAEQQQRFAELAHEYDVVILCSALWKFNQTLLLEATYKKLKALGKKTYIIAIGSTTDRVMKATDWLYNAEKKALRDYCNSLGLNGVWNEGPRVSYISFGTLSNMQEKHPSRRTINVPDAANYINWLINQPSYLHINEISIDPLQT